jgi:hypothetical protein
MSVPSHAATYERAGRLANLAMWTIALQRRRLRSDEPEDTEFVLRRWADFQFLIAALYKLRRSALLAASVPVIETDIRSALHEFDEALPMLKSMRDIDEHFEDYALEKGKRKGLSRKTLEVGAFDDTTFEWLGYELNVDAALNASQRLFARCNAAIIDTLPEVGN